MGGLGLPELDDQLLGQNESVDFALRAPEDQTAQANFEQTVASVL